MDKNMEKLWTDPILHHSPRYAMLEVKAPCAALGGVLAFMGSSEVRFWSRDLEHPGTMNHQVFFSTSNLADVSRFRLLDTLWCCFLSMLKLWLVKPTAALFLGFVHSVSHHERSSKLTVTWIMEYLTKFHILGPHFWAFVFHDGLQPESQKVLDFTRTKLLLEPLFLTACRLYPPWKWHFDSVSGLWGTVFKMHNHTVTELAAWQLLRWVRFNEFFLWQFWNFALAHLRWKHLWLNSCSALS